MYVASKCPHCDSNIGHNFNLGVYHVCRCDGAKAERKARQDAYNSPEAVAERARTAEARRLESAERAVDRAKADLRSATFALKVAEGKLRYLRAGQQPYNRTPDSRDSN